MTAYDDKLSSPPGCNWGAIGAFAGTGGIVAKILAFWPGYNEDWVNLAVECGLFGLNSYLFCAIAMTRVHEGYPREWVENRRRGRLKSLKWLGGIGILAVLLMLHGVVKSDEHFHNYAFLLELGLACAGLFVYMIHRDDVLYFAPYFESQMPSPMRWSAEVARHSQKLDELATGLRVRPLSTFGFADDWPNTGIAMTYYRPEIGIETLTALLRELHELPEEWARSSALQEELEHLRDRLEAAADKNIRFRFILHGNAINATEVEQRKGFF